MWGRAGVYIIRTRVR